MEEHGNVVVYDEILRGLDPYKFSDVLRQFPRSREKYTFLSKDEGTALDYQISFEI